MAKQKIAVLFGGRSGEHNISLVSARGVVNALDKNKYDIYLIGITKEGKWISGSSTFELLETLKDKPLTPSLALKNKKIENLSQQRTNQSLVPSLLLESKIKFDAVIPILHGPYGEDGTIQGLLEIANVPYVGSGVLGSAMGMDKIAMKMIFQANDLPICRYVWFVRSEWEKNENKIIKTVEKDLGYPCFVKPANLGSSVGISKAHDQKELIFAIRLAARYDRRVLVEEGVNCREVECAVLGNDNPKISLPAEIIPGKEFYDYEAKYTEGLSQTQIPAKLPKSIISLLQEISRKAFIALDLAGMARVDFFIRKENNEIILNEVNTIPGFTNTSMFPKLWEASGIKYSKLLDNLIELAIARHRENVIKIQ